MQTFLERLRELEQTVARLQNSPCVGIVAVSKNDPVMGPVARFTLPDQDGKTTAFIQVAQKSCLGRSEYSLPRPGERMLIHKMPNGAEGAIAHGAMYSASVTTPPQENDQNHHTTFDDGSTITITPQGGMNLVATTQITVDCLGGLTIHTGGAVNITASAVTISAPSITLVGNVEIQGNLHVTGDINNDGNMNTGGRHNDAIGLHSA